MCYRNEHKSDDDNDEDAEDDNGYATAKDDGNDDDDIDGEDNDGNSSGEDDESEWTSLEDSAPYLALFSVICAWMICLDKYFLLWENNDSWTTFYGWYGHCKISKTLPFQIWTSEHYTR